MKNLIRPRVKKETEKAILVESQYFLTDSTDPIYATFSKTWIPKSACEVKKERNGSDDVYVKDWVIAESKKYLKVTNRKEEEYILGFVGHEELK